MGTFLDGQRITEVTLEEGEHVLRVGGALLTVATTAQHGTDVVPVVKTEKVAPLTEAEIAARAQKQAATAAPDTGKRSVLVCIDGPLNGQEFEIPPTGLIVGREGHVRVPDEYLSRKHFEVAPDPEGAMRVRDLGSRNGTFLNTLPASNTKVQSGDEIRAGTNRFRIERRP
jgi:pSer/pThr/pTyr-binding forkhead associated (FHA) protein